MFARNSRREFLLGVLCLTLFLGVAALLSPAGAGAQSPGPCQAGWVKPTSTVIAVTSVPITVSSTEDDYFVLYRKHQRGPYTVVNVPVLVKRGESGTTLLSESLSSLGADQYRVEKYLVANPADVDGDCVDDITELDNFGYRNPMNEAMPFPAEDGSVALEDHAAFEALSYQVQSNVLDESLNNLEYVKFTILDVDTASPKLWFQDTNRHRLHWSTVQFRQAGFVDFVHCCWQGHAGGTLIYHPNVVAPDGSLGVYRWQWSRTSTDFREVSIVHETLAAAMPFLKDNLAYYPFASNDTESKYELQKSSFDASRVNVLLESDILPDVEYMAYNKAEGYGLLGVFKPDESPGPRDVAILSVLPNDLPRAAGVITTVPQTPLSHVNLRAIQNGVPNAFIRDALTDEAVTDLVGRYVHYRATANGYMLRAATKSEVDDHHAASRPKQTQTLQRNLTKTSITSLSGVSFADWTAFGVKAANVAELSRLTSLAAGVAPDGYAVPFYFYDEFMKQAAVSKETILGKKKAPADEKITLPIGTTLDSAVTQMLAHSRFQTDADIQEEMLDDLRKTIKNATSPAWIITALTTMHNSYPTGTSLRYRSSTNNEDLSDFNGAGLYDSKTQDPDETSADGIDKSIKAVWASLWNHRAFLERDFHRVDHTTVAMGVLVHPNYSDEKVNGVAVSFDPVTGRDGYYYVNTQLGEDLVTNPEALSLPEELLLDLAGAPTVLARSNLAPANQLLMTKAQMIYLRYSLKAIHDRFNTLYSPAQGEDFAVEIEFKITAQNKLAIKQARPWVFSQPLSACVPQLPTDAVTVDEVKGWRDAHNDPDHVRRWNRVLAALGVDTGETKLTAAESKMLETLFTEGRWERTTRTLAAIEICHPSTATTTPVISIVAGGDVTEGGDTEFTMTASPVPAADLNVTVAVAQSGDFGATTGVRTVTMPPSGSYTLTVATSDDSSDEADGSVTATLNSGSGYTVSEAAGSATVAVSDDDLAPVDVCVTALSGDGSVTGEWTGECDSVGRSGRYARFFTFSLDNQTVVRIDLESSWDTYMFLRSGAGGDGQELHQDDDGGNGRNSQISYSLAAGDYTIEATTYGREKTGAFTLSVVGLPDQAPPVTEPEINIAAGADITEGGSATFTITATPNPTADLDVTVEVSQSGDYASTGAQTVTIPTMGSQTLTVTTTNDSTDEADGSVTATVSTGTGYTVSSSASAATVAVFDDDAPSLPEVSIDAGADITEGGNATFTVTATPAPSTQLTVNYTVSQSGNFGVSVTTGSVNIYSGGSSAITITTTNDDTSEADGSVSVTLITSQNYTVSTSAGSATMAVSDDDSSQLPPQSVIDSCVSHSVLTTVRRYYDVNKDRAPNYGRNWKRVLVTFRNVEDSQLTPFTAAEALAGEQQWFGWRPIREALECIEAATNPPPPTVPAISIAADTDVTEGSDATFTVTAAPAPSADLDVTVEVSQSGNYVTTGTRTVTIPSSGSKTFTVTTTDDSDDEPDGSVTATISSVDGYTVSSSAGAATVAIADNDTCTPTLPSDAVTIAEITGWRDGLDPTRAAAGIKRFNRVLSTLGVGTGETPMTVQQAKAVSNWLKNTRWDRIARTLAAMESSQCDTTPSTESVITITAGNNITEGGDATFVVIATPAPTTALTVDLTVSQSGSFGATTGTDTVTITTSGSATFTVSTINDSTDEPNGSVTATLLTGTGYTVSGTSNAATVAVSDDDEPLPAMPTISIAAGSRITEGSDAAFTVTASPAPTAALTVNVTISQSGNFGAMTGSRTVTVPTSGSLTVTVSTINDNTDESNGSVTATVTTGTGYTVSQSAGLATVAVSDNDDPQPVNLPTVSISDGQDYEDYLLIEFYLELSHASSVPVTVTIEMEEGTATYGGDFLGIDSTHTIAPGQTRITLYVPLRTDLWPERDETFTIKLTSATGATIADDTGNGIIINDD